MIIKSSKWSLLNYKSRVFFVRLTASFGSWFFPIACAYIYPEVGLALVFLFVKSSRFISAFGNFGIATIIESDNITEKIMNSHAILLFFLFVGYVTWSNIYSINFDIVDTLIVSNGFTGSLLLNYRRAPRKFRTSAPRVDGFEGVRNLTCWSLAHAIRYNTTR